MSGCLPPTTFEYGHAHGFLSKVETLSIGIPEDPCHGPFFADFDGGGKTDVLWSDEDCSDPTVNIWFNDDSGLPAETLTFDVPIPESAAVQILDLDGDHSMDLLFAEDATHFRQIAQLRNTDPLGIFFYSTSHSTTEVSEIAGDAELQLVGVDLDMDGYSDVVTCEPSDTPGWNHLKFYRGSPAGAILDFEEPINFWDLQVGWNVVGCHPGRFEAVKGFGRNFVKVQDTGASFGEPYPGAPDCIQTLDPPLAPVPCSDYTAPIPRKLFFAEGRPTEMLDAGSRPVASGRLRTRGANDDLGPHIEFSTSLSPAWNANLADSDGWSPSSRLEVLEYGRNGGDYALPGVSSGQNVVGPRLLVATQTGPITAEPSLGVLSVLLFDYDGDGFLDLVQGGDSVYEWVYRWEPYWTPEVIPLTDFSWDGIGRFSEEPFDQTQIQVQQLPSGRYLLPVQAQLDNDPSLELLVEDEYGDIEIWDRSSPPTPMELIQVVDGFGQKTLITYSNAPVRHVPNSTCGDNLLEVGYVRLSNT